MRRKERMKLQKNMETEKKIDELLAKMTMEEKVGQLKYAGSDCFHFLLG